MPKYHLVLVILLIGCGGDNDDFSLPEYIDVEGIWEGSATFTNNCENPSCSYQGTLNPASIIIVIVQVINILEGTITLNLPQGVPQFAGPECNPLTGSISILRAQSSISGTQVKLTQNDFLGVWDLQIAGAIGPQSTMQGTLTSTAPGCTGLTAENVSLVRIN